MCDVELEFSLVELQRPPDMMGYRLFGLRSIIYMTHWLFSRDDAYWEARGGESYPQLIARIEAARHTLEQENPRARLVVVSHSIFINFFMVHVCNSKPMNIFTAVLRIFKIRGLGNSSISHMRYSPAAEENTCAWELVEFAADEHVVPAPKT